MRGLILAATLVVALATSALAMPPVFKLDAREKPVCCCSPCPFDETGKLGVREQIGSSLNALS
jgi:hypothetical protein